MVSYSFARRKHRTPPQAQECFDAGLLTAVGKPTFPLFPSPYFFASDDLCRSSSVVGQTAPGIFARFMAPRGDNIVIQLCPTPESGNRSFGSLCSRGKTRLKPGHLLLHLRNEFADQVLAMRAHLLELDSLAILTNPYHPSARVDAFARRRQSKR